MSSDLCEHPEVMRGVGGWVLGDGDIRVYTAAGAEYGIDSNGWVAGGTRVIRGTKRNKLLGSTRGPRRSLVVGCVVPGLRLEIHRAGRPMFWTSAVVRWEQEELRPSRRPIPPKGRVTLPR